MSQANVDIVRKLFEDYRRGDYDEAIACLAPDVVYETGQELAASGPAAVRAMWERWDGAWVGLETVPEEYIDGGERVVVAVRYRGRGRGSGMELEDLLFDVYTLREGKCVHKADFRERSEALAAAGLEA